MKSHYAPGELQVDFGFFGRNVRFLLMVHVLSGYLSTVVSGPEDPVPGGGPGVGNGLPQETAFCRKRPAVGNSLHQETAETILRHLFRKK